MNTFTVKRIAVETKRLSYRDRVLTIYLADREDGSGETFMFQLNLDEGDDEMEKELGMDTYCLTTAQSQMTHYGGVTRYKLTPGALTLFLDKRAKRAFNAKEGIRFELLVDEKSKKLLRKALPKVFPDVPFISSE